MVHLMLAVHSSERLPEHRYRERIFQRRGELRKDFIKPKGMRHQKGQALTRLSAMMVPCLLLW